MTGAASKSSSANANRLGATPAKIGLIAVLALVLIVSAVINLGGLGAAAPERTAGAKRRSKRVPKVPNRPTTRNVASSGKATRKVLREIDWPGLNVSEASEFDPFAKPEFLQPPPPEPTPVVVEEQPTKAEVKRVVDAKKLKAMRSVVVSLAELGIEMIIATPDGGVARVAGREIRIGDMIEGLIVTRIDSDGIELALPADPSNTRSGR